MNKEIAGESVGKKQVKSSIIAFTFGIYLYRLWTYRAIVLDIYSHRAEYIDAIR
ncbi:hypothetical protein [Bacteroides caecimuris]|uniref:hypothetical protein n=1 Tax=Bacteroides caecimuris TaxID=1796613 RepID=UPI001C3E2F8B|nr:hypothetical protein [Bacteroides caecimuris]